MKLLHKGFLLIAIPILAQFAFVIALVAVQHHADELAWKDMHYRTQTQELMSTTILMYKAIGILSAYGVSSNTESIQEFDIVYEQLQRKVELLSLLDQDSPSGAARDAQRVTKQMLHDLYATRQILAVKGPVASGPSLMLLVRDLKKEIGESLAAYEKLMDERAKAGLTGVEQADNRRAVMNIFIVSGFAINLLVDVVFLLLIGKSFARQLAIILDNTGRVSRGEELNELSKGHQELDVLDKTMHEMYSSLKDAEARKQQLMNMVSHDLRGPLTSVQISLELILRQRAADVSEYVSRKLTETERVVRRLSRLVDDILDFDKLKVGKLDINVDVVSLEEIVPDCVTELEPILQRDNITVTLALSHQPVVADRERVPQVIINLLTNAIKFSPKGSTISISTTIEVFPDKKEFVKLSIRDQGPGVPEQYRDTIFLPFEQVPDDKRPKKGTTGLGLPICKMLVELHGGQIGVEVPPAGGSIFWFTLPAAQIEEL